MIGDGISAVQTTPIKTGAAVSAPFLPPRSIKPRFGKVRTPTSQLILRARASDLRARTELSSPGSADFLVHQHFKSRTPASHFGVWKEYLPGCSEWRAGREGRSRSGDHPWGRPEQLVRPGWGLSKSARPGYAE